MHVVFCITLSGFHFAGLLDTQSDVVEMSTHRASAAPSTSGAHLRSLNEVPLSRILQRRALTVAVVVAIFVVGVFVRVFSTTTLPEQLTPPTVLANTTVFDYTEVYNTTLYV